MLVRELWEIRGFTLTDLSKLELDSGHVPTQLCVCTRSDIKKTIPIVLGTSPLFIRLLQGNAFSTFMSPKYIGRMNVARFSIYHLRG